MHTRISPLKFLLFIFSLSCSAFSQHLTDAQINIVKQRLQESATHRSASRSISYPVSFFVERTLCASHPPLPWQSPRHLNDGYGSTVIPPDRAKLFTYYLQLGNRRSCTSSSRALRSFLFLSDSLTAPIPSLTPELLHQRFSRRRIHNRTHHRRRAPSPTNEWLWTAPFYRGHQRGRSRKRRHCGLDCKLDAFPKRRGL